MAMTRGRRADKGEATVELSDRTPARAEVYWYEAHGISCRELEVKRLVR